jgi:SM-20-related protein
MSPAPRPEPRDDAALPADMAEDLRRAGYAVRDGLLEEPLLHALAADCAARSAGGALRRAGTGRGEPTLDAALRGDSIQWLEAGAPEAPASRFLARMDRVRHALNRELLLGLHELEAHYAVYPPGAGYARHRDRFRDDDARVLSLVVYLNPDWRDDDGGALRLHLPQGPLDVAPRLGTAVLFLSDEVEHEVLPARRARMSIAGWFRRRPLT